MTNVLRLATVQFALRPEPTFDGFRRHITAVVDQAARAGAEVVLLPELVSTGLLASAPDADQLTAEDMTRVYHTLFPAYTEEYAAHLRALAASRGVWLLGGSHYRSAPDGTRNTAYLAHPDGRLESQDKLHLTPPEVAVETGRGDDVLVTTIRGVRVGVQICMDLQFPEITRYLADQDVQLVLAPSLTFNRRGVHRIRYAGLSRANENQLFVAVSTLVGTCGVPTGAALRGAGRAFVACPIDRNFGVNDGVLAESASETGEEVVVTELDFDRLAYSRAHPEPPGLANRRPDLYQRLAVSPRTVRS